MRNLFLILLLANLLFAGWRLWIAPPDVPPRQSGAAGPGTALQLAIRHHGEVVEKPGGGPSGPAPGMGPGEGAVTGAGGEGSEGRCTRIGPILDGQVLDRLRARLLGRGITASTQTEDGQVWVGHWVQLESVPGREEADRMVARLAAAGVPDAYVFQSAPPFTVSLGVFRDKAHAERVAARAAELGFHPQLTDRYRAGTKYWLLLPMTPAGPPGLDDLSQESGEILRAETVPCRSAPVGATAPIN